MTDNELKPGRSCPIHYHYPLSVFSVPAQTHAETLYVAGGIYGNIFALKAAEELYSLESGSKHMVFNGDFNWFNVDTESFRSINQTVLTYDAIRGNVETELASDDPFGGCGCGYPEWVDEAIVDRSNAIMARLAQIAIHEPALLKRLRELPMTCVIQVGKSRIGIVHGDASSLAGWGFAQETLATLEGSDQARAWLNESQVDVFSSSHTGLPVMQSWTLSDRRRGLVVNNGAAGVPNFSGQHFGILTRVSTRPCSNVIPIFEKKFNSLWVSWLPLRYDQKEWLKEFERLWPHGSDADVAYGERMRLGSNFTLEKAVRTG